MCVCLCRTALTDYSLTRTSPESGGAVMLHRASAGSPSLLAVFYSNGHDEVNSFGPRPTALIINIKKYIYIYGKYIFVLRENVSKNGMVSILIELTGEWGFLFSFFFKLFFFFFFLMK